MRGEGRIFKRGSIYWIAYCANGREYRESADSQDETVAKRKLKKALAKVECDVFIPPSQARLTFEDMAADLTNYYTVNNKTSLESLPYYLRHLRLAFGMDRARSITAARIGKYTAARLEDGAKPASINKELGALRRMFKLAVEGKRLSATSVPSIKLLSENNARQGFVEPADFIRLRIYSSA